MSVQEDRSGAPEDRSGSEGGKSTWSDEDKRNLIISFVGGLAANIGIVLIIGGAVAIDRVINTSSYNKHNAAYLTFAGLGAYAILYLFFLWVIQSSRKRRGRSGFPGFLKVILWIYLAMLGVSMLVFIGVAAGLGK